MQIEQLWTMSNPNLVKTYKENFPEEVTRESISTINKRIKRKDMTPEHMVILLKGLVNKTTLVDYMSLVEQYRKADPNFEKHLLPFWINSFTSTGKIIQDYISTYGLTPQEVSFLSSEISERGITPHLSKHYLPMLKAMVDKGLWSDENTLETLLKAHDKSDVREYLFEIASEKVLEKYFQKNPIDQEEYELPREVLQNPHIFDVLGLYTIQEIKSFCINEGGFSVYRSKLVAGDLAANPGLPISEFEKVLPEMSLDVFDELPMSGSRLDATLSYLNTLSEEGKEDLVTSLIRNRSLSPRQYHIVVEEVRKHTDYGAITDTAILIFALAGGTLSDRLDKDFLTPFLTKEVVLTSKDTIRLLLSIFSFSELFSLLDIDKQNKLDVDNAFWGETRSREEVEFFLEARNYSDAALEEALEDYPFTLDIILNLPQLSPKIKAELLQKYPDNIDVLDKLIEDVKGSEELQKQLLLRHGTPKKFIDIIVDSLSDQTSKEVLLEVSKHPDVSEDVVGDLLEKFSGDKEFLKSLVSSGLSSRSQVFLDKLVSVLSNSPYENYVYPEWVANDYKSFPAEGLIDQFFDPEIQYQETLESLARHTDDLEILEKIAEKAELNPVLDALSQNVNLTSGIIEIIIERGDDFDDFYPYSTEGWHVHLAQQDVATVEQKLELLQQDAYALEDLVRREELDPEQLLRAWGVANREEGLGLAHAITEQTLPGEVAEIILNEVQDWGNDDWIDDIVHNLSQTINVLDEDYVDKAKLRQIDRVYKNPDMPNLAYPDDIKNAPVHLENFEKEYLFKLKSYMEEHNEEKININLLLDKSSPYFKMFGEIPGSKGQLDAMAKAVVNGLKKKLPSKFITLSDLDSLGMSQSVSDKHDISYTTWSGMQRHIKNKDNLVIQLNFKKSFLADLYEEHGGDFQAFYIELARKSLYGGHPVLPIPGKTFGWARITYIEDEEAILVDEIQTDWSTLTGKMKAFIRGDGGYDLEDFVPRNFVGHDPDELEEWVDIIQKGMLDNFENLMLQAVLDFCRRHGFRKIYMTTEAMKTHIGNPNKRKKIYKQLPKRFRFHEKKVDLGEGEQTYWYRTARRLK